NRPDRVRSYSYGHLRDRWAPHSHRGQSRLASGTIGQSGHRRMRYDSGEIVVDGDARQLRVHGEAVHVSSKAFDLLCLLIENRPRALSKQQIHDRLWPDTFVGEASLPVLIREL